MSNPWLGIGLVLVILAVLLAVLGRVDHEHHAEAVRKSLHVSMGLVTLSFPWLFSQTWPVLLLACLTMLAFLALRVFPVLGLRLGAAMYRVSRASHGEMYFVLGTGTVFCLSAGDVLMYGIPMLMLTFADSAAALVGTRYGRHRYAGGHGQKTVEGSAAFFVVALCCTYLPLWLFATAQSTGLAPAAVLVAAIATGLEAIAGRGLDNLAVPVGAYIALEAIGVSAGPRSAGYCDLDVQVALFLAISSTALVGIFVVQRCAPPRAVAPNRRQA